MLAAALALVLPLLREKILPLLLISRQGDREAAIAGEDVVVVGATARARGVLRGRRVALVPEPGELSLQRAENGVRSIKFIAEL